MKQFRQGLLSLASVLVLAGCAASPPMSPAIDSQLSEVGAVALKTGTADLVPLENREGTVTVQIQPITLVDAGGSSDEQWTFTVRLDTNDMSLPPLNSIYDLSQLATLQIAGHEPSRPSAWVVEQEGHMGHHIQGTLVFPAASAGDTMRVIIREVGNVDERIFEWDLSS